MSCDGSVWLFNYEIKVLDLLPEIVNVYMGSIRGQWLI